MAKKNEKEKITAKYVWILKKLLTCGKPHGMFFLKK